MHSHRITQPPPCGKSGEAQGERRKWDHTTSDLGQNSHHGEIMDAEKLVSASPLEEYASDGIRTSVGIPVMVNCGYSAHAANSIVCFFALCAHYALSEHTLPPVLVPPQFPDRESAFCEVTGSHCKWCRDYFGQKLVLSPQSTPQA
ncbi:hypothetical protein HII12_000046 [Brettanomyces bruxellensis]|uniref:Uncharacterized protein n=1 Tax=Dekkera bruxellensis TaxID=5007 RepID=A0A8H6BRA6_DEKBR|nr:hypothetical protein HII12_000046 [Brettanomyces bruxellensis]